MRVLLVWDSDYPWDIRVEKICRTLLDSGHSVHLVCRNVRQSPIREVLDGIEIRRLRVVPSWFRWLDAGLTFPFFANPIWIRALVSAAAESECDIIIVRDLPLCPAAIAVGKKFGKPVILDMAECYSEMLRATWQFENFRLQNIFARNPYLADLIERWSIRRVTQIWAMVEESRDRLMRLGVPPRNVRIVGNTPTPSRFNPAQKAAGRSDGLLQLVYVGLLNPSRGLDVTLRAVAYANQGGAKVHLTLIGTGKSAANLRDLVRHLDIEAAVTFKGWMDNKEIPKEIAAADCGIVPHRECSHWHHTIPNKLFDYMAASRPVIVSSARPAARIVREAECGLVYKNDDPADLARQILTLGSPELRHRLGKNGLNAVQTKYRWEKDAAVLLEGLTAAVSDHSGKGRR